LARKSEHARVGANRPGPGKRRFIEHAASLPPDLIGRYAEPAKHFHGRAFDAHQAEQDMFGANVMMTEVRGLVNCIFKDLLGITGQFKPGTDRVTFHRDASDHFAHAARFQSEFAQDASGNASILFD